MIALNPHPRTLRFAVGLLLGLTSLPGTSSAGPFDTYGYGSRAIGMGGAMTAEADDYTAVFYNPANLTLKPNVTLGLDFYGALPQTEITTDSDSDPDYSPEQLQGQGGTSFGVQYPFGGLIENKLALGFGIHLPYTGLLDVKLLDPQVPQWYLYDALPNNLQILAGASYKPLSWLHLGVGFQGLAHVDGDARFEVDLTNTELPRRDLSVQLVNTGAPTAGILLTPPVLPGLKLAAAYRGSLALEFQLPILFDFGESLDVVVGATGVTLFIPDQFALGASFDLQRGLDLPLTLTCDLTWSRWSLAPPPNFEIFIDVGGDLTTGLGLDDNLDFTTGSEPNPSFRDTLTPRVGLEATVNPHLMLRAGYAFRPAALPPQTGFTNYVDSDTHILSAGIAVAVPDPLQIHDTPFSFEFSAQSLVFESLNVIKEDPNNAIGDYSAGGNILTLSFSVRHSY